jgi:hypothetical protein
MGQVGRKMEQREAAAEREAAAQRKPAVAVAWAELRPQRRPWA